MNPGSVLALIKVDLRANQILLVFIPEQQNRRAGRDQGRAETGPTVAVAHRRMVDWNYIVARRQNIIHRML
jgi:hypothetical protein